MNLTRRLLNEFWGAIGFVERDFALVKRYLGWEVYWLVYSAVAGITIALIGVTTGDKDLVLFLVVGAIVWGFLSLLFEFVSETVAWEMWEGTLELTFMAPIKRLTMLLGNTLFAVIYGLVRSALILAAMALFFSINLGGANLLTALVVLVVSSLAFIGLGLPAAVLPILNREKGVQASHIFQAGLLLVSGVYYSIDTLPSWLRPVSVISPATYTLRSMRAAIMDGAGLADVAGDLAIIALIAAVSIPLGMLIFSAGERWAKWKGKLKIEG
jgi:ABC-2 type transport system permease protein